MTDISAILDTIDAMVYQESTAYHPPTMDDNDRSISDRLSRVGIESRGRMLRFYFDLMDKIGSSRETAEIAVNYLDRFLALHPEALRNKKFFQLMSTTCLYTAVKIHELQAVTPSLLADISHGIFTAQDVEEMELILIHALQWRLSPPTSLAFVRYYLDIIPQKFMTNDTKKRAYDLARYQTEFALQDPLLFCERKSLVAYAAVQNALEHLLVYNVDLSTTVGVILKTEDSDSLETSSFACSAQDLQTALFVALSQKLGLVAPDFSASPTNIIPPAPAPAPSKSWFALPLLGSLSNHKQRSQFQVSPRSVNNTVA